MMVLMLKVAQRGEGQGWGVRWGWPHLQTPLIGRVDVLITGV